jgi:hypothetical protein
MIASDLPEAANRKAGKGTQCGARRNMNGSAGTLSAFALRASADKSLGPPHALGMMPVFVTPSTARAVHHVGPKIQIQ